jgi:phosphoesterase RecJ-like protein
MINENKIEKSFGNFPEKTREELRQRIMSPGKVLILSHKNPDGDAVGSALGLAGVLEKIGHQVKVFLPDEAPDFLKWLPGYNKTGIYEKKPGDFPGFEQAPDLVFFVDFNTPERLGGMEEAAVKLESYKFLIDHHPDNHPFYDHAIIDTSRGSTSELIFLLLEQLELDDMIDANSATCLYTGIITDTLGLQVSSSYGEAYRVVGNLVSRGIRVEDVYNRIYNQFSLNRMRLLGYCLSEKMKILPEYNTAYIWLTKAEMSEHRHLKGDTEGFVNYPLSIKNISFTVLFTEIEGEIKLSLRSKGKIPANQFAARYFSGGGHRNAAGGRSQLSMEETIKKFEEYVKHFMPDYVD